MKPSSKVSVRLRARRKVGNVTARLTETQDASMLPEIAERQLLLGVVRRRVEGRSASVLQLRDVIFGLCLGGDPHLLGTGESLPVYVNREERL